ARSRGETMDAHTEFWPSMARPHACIGNSRRPEGEQSLTALRQSLQSILTATCGRADRSVAIRAHYRSGSHLRDKDPIGHEAAATECELEPCGIVSIRTLVEATTPSTAQTCCDPDGAGGAMTGERYLAPERAQYRPRSTLASGPSACEPKKSNPC